MKNKYQEIISMFMKIYFCAIIFILFAAGIKPKAEQLFSVIGLKA